MSRRGRILRNVAIGLAALIGVVVVTALVVVHTNWFRNMVREKIIASTEEATGGKVTLGSFYFDVGQMRATVTDFVIHGKEPAGAKPFLRVPKVDIDLRLFTSIHHLVDIRYAGIERPEASVMVFPDGTTNLPSPKTPAGTPSNQTPLATVVDLAIGHFQVSNGAIEFNHQKQALNLRGNNLRVVLDWNVLKQSYVGQLSMEPLYMVSGHDTPVVVKITVPAEFERDRILVRNASITTAQSDLRVDATVENMNNPKTTVRLNGYVAMADLTLKNVAMTLNVDANATLSNNAIHVGGLRVTAGKSNLEASSDSEGAIEFKSTLELGELGRTLKLTFRPGGQVLLNGKAKIDASYNYDVDGNIQGKNVSAENIRNVNLASAMHVDPHHIDLRGLRLSAMGGEFSGNAALEDLARYHAEGKLLHLELQPLLRQFVPQQRLPYDGAVSGTINLTGDTHTAGLKSIVATAQLNIAPGRRGIPVSGHINADYRGSNDLLALRDSIISLPHTSLTVNGSAARQLDVAVTSTDLHDIPMLDLPVALNRGKLSFQGAVTGGLSAPHISGHLAADRFSVEDRQFDSLQADVTATKSQAAVKNGVLTRAAMRANFDGTIGMTYWHPLSSEPLTANVVLRNGDLADLMVLAGQPPEGYSGTLSADAHIKGTVGDPQGSASIQGSNGVLHGESFDQLQARVALTHQLATIQSAYLISGPSRIDLSGEYQHPDDDFTIGHLHAKVQTNQIDLGRIHTLQQEEPNTAGIAQVNADVTGDLGATFLLSSVNGTASVKGLRFQGQNYGDLNATADTSGHTVTYQADSNFSGSTLHVNGHTDLTADYPTTADAAIRNLQIAPVLALAHESSIPARGSLSGSVHVSGTMKNPQGNADVDLTNARIYDEPLDHVHAKVTYLANSIDVQQLEATAGPSRIDLTARYDHAPQSLESGKLQFHMNSNAVDLARIHNLQKLRPGIGGRLQITADGTTNIGAKILVTSLNANVAANGLSTQGKNLGDLTLNATTASGGRLNVALKSNVAGSTIDGSGNVQLSGNYVTNAQMSFKNVAWSKLQPLLGPATGEPASFDGVTDGQVSINGPVLDTTQLRGTLQLSRLSVTSIPRPGSGIKPVGIQNSDPVEISLDKGAVRVQNFKLAGPKTTIDASGTASLTNRSLALSLKANADLALLDNFSQDLDSAGSIVVATSIRGTMSQPQINGTLDLKSARIHYAGFSNGISNANGTIVFNGNSATIRNLTAETGGGTIIASGFVGYSNTLRFGLRATASNSRILIQQGVSAVTEADIHLTGTANRSLLSGTVTIDTLTYRPQSDIGALLSRAAPPVQAPSAPSPVLDNMRIDIRVRTSSALAVQASLAQNLQADADLRIRGTASQPGVLGRVNISEGQLVFFGSTYTVNSGSIGFYNPVRIDPVLDISLETKAKGVDVVLHVTGPIDNMKLSYTSDPPLQFQEIIGLLAAGKTPTSDPTLLANQPSEPQQSFQQMGESALVSKALADPVSSRLQRVFGVSQFKIDPAFAGGTQLPQARLTLQQQISSNLTFTYVSALNDPNTTVIRVEWAFNPRWSAVATRDENGIVSLNFFYKKQFR